MRSETEWKEIVSVGAAVISDADETAIFNAWEKFSANPPIIFPAIFGDGNAAEFICKKMLSII